MVKKINNVHFLPFRKLYNFLKDGKSFKLSPEVIFSSVVYAILFLVMIVAGQNFAAEREEYQNKIQIKMEELDNRIDVLHNEVEEVPKETFVNRWIDQLQGFKEEIVKRFKEMQSASAEQWKEFSVTLDGLVHKADGAYNIINRDYFYWKVESKLKEIVKKQHALGELRKRVKWETKEAWVLFSNNIKKINQQIQTLKSADPIAWKKNQPDIELALKEIENSANDLNRQIHLVLAEKKLADNKNKLSKLQNKMQSSSNPLSDVQKQGLDNFQEKIVLVSDEIQNFSSADENWKEANRDLQSAIMEMENAYNQIASLNIDSR